MPGWLGRTVVRRLSSTGAQRVRAVRDRQLPLTVLAAQRAPVPRPVSAALARRRGNQLSDGSLTVAHLGPRALLASPLPGIRLEAVRAANLGLVVDVLDAEGIDYFLVDNRSDTRTAVAVSSTDRERLLDVLRERWAKEAVYVGLIRRGEQSFELPVLARRALDASGTATASVLRVFRAYAAGSFLAADGFGCDIEFWRPAAGGRQWVAPRENRVAPSVPRDSAPLPVTVGDRTVRSIEPFAVRTQLDIDFPVDVVYTWVDGADPAWAARRDAHLGRSTDRYNETAVNDSRYLSRDELRYSLRSIEMFAPWVRHVYLVTDDQVPTWLDPACDWVSVVDHRDIFRDTSVLPTFNSHAIESQLHHIDGLAEHYLYFNDDMLLGRPVRPGRFFHDNGLAKMFLSTARIDYGEPSIDEPPVMAAAKNNRELLLRDFGCYLTQKQKHVPYPHRRSIMEELEKRYPEEFARTAASRFRHPTDVSIASSLQQYYGFFTGRTVPATISYSYFDLAEPNTPTRLEVAERDQTLDAFCLNDTDSSTIDLAQQQRMLQSFLGRYFPVPSSCELPDDRTGQR